MKDNEQVMGVLSMFCWCNTHYNITQMTIITSSRKRRSVVF